MAPLYKSMQAATDRSTREVSAIVGQRQLRVAFMVSVARTLDAFFLDWFEAWEKDGLLITTLSAGRPEKSTLPHREIPSLRQRPALAVARAIAETREALAAVKPDIVITSTATSSGVARVANHGFPVVYFTHGLHWPGVTRFGGAGWKIIERSLISRTSAFIAINCDDAAWLRARAAPERVLHLRGGVGLDLARWSRIRRRPIPGKVVVIGDIAHRKQPLEIVRIFDRLRRSVPYSTLHFVGDGPLQRETAALADKLNCEAVITFSGHVADVGPHLSTAAVVLHASMWEGLPRALLEAVASGVPVVAYDAKGTRDVPGIRLIPKGHRDAAVNALSGILESRSASAPALLDQDFDSRQCAARAAEFLRRYAQSR